MSACCGCPCCNASLEKLRLEGSDATFGGFIRFLRISKGSCDELRTQLYISERVQKALDLEPFANSREMIKETREISAMLEGLIRSIENRRPNWS